MTDKKRRAFLKKSVALTAGMGLYSAFPAFSGIKKNNEELFFKISLAEWSLHKTLFSGKMTNMDFPGKAKNDFNISALEFVNQFFKDKAEDKKYLQELKDRCEDLGVTCVLIMIDGEGPMADLDDAKRNKAVENHYKWVDAAKFLGCHSIRVNAYGQGSFDEVRQAAVQGLGKLSEYGAKTGINIIVENHGGLSSNGKWLTQVMSEVNNPYCGTLPDFGNFCITGKWENGKMNCTEAYDRYLGTQELMKYAKGVSAKSHEFDENGNETEIDYKRMLQIVKEAGYHGFIGVEFEGSIPEDEGIIKTRDLLIKAGKELG
jgi:sugar phosphate isomerase/epimerase